jgi:GGDEF domain-containing protein
MLAVLVVVRLTMAFQFQSFAAVARLSGSEFGVILADTRNPIGLCFTPSLALALPAVRSGEGSATGPL